MDATTVYVFRHPLKHFNVENTTQIIFLIKTRCWNDLHLPSWYFADVWEPVLFSSVHGASCTISSLYCCTLFDGRPCGDEMAWGGTNETTDVDGLVAQGGTNLLGDVYLGICGGRFNKAPTSGSVSRSLSLSLWFWGTRVDSLILYKSVSSMTMVRGRDACFFLLATGGEVPPIWSWSLSMDWGGSFHFTKSSLCLPEAVGGAISWFNLPPHISNFKSPSSHFTKLIR